MDEVESQQKQIGAAVSAAFGARRSQLRVHLDESGALKSELEKKTEELRDLQQSISNIDAVRQENKRLKDELLALQSHQKSTSSSQRYRDLEHERDALRQDNRLKQKTIDALQSIVRYEKSKLKDWSRHSSASPHGTSPRKLAEASRELESTNLARSVSPVSRQAHLRKLISPLENTEATGKSSAPVAERRSEEAIKTMSVEASPDKNALPVQEATDRTGRLNGPLSFPDFDTTQSGDIPSEHPPTTSPPRRSSCFVRRLSISPILHKRSIPFVTDAGPSDLTATPPQSRREREISAANLHHCSVPDSIEIVNRRPFEQKAQEANAGASHANFERPETREAERRICAKSEPAESLQNSAGTTTDLTFTVEEPRRGVGFWSPKRDRDPQGPAVASTKRILQIAEDECLSALEDDKKATAPPELAQLRPLQDIQNEKRSLARTSNGSDPPTKRHRSNDRGATSISSIAEDGEDHNRSHKMTGKLLRHKSPTRSTNSIYRRLDSLLERPSPVRRILAEPSPWITCLTDGHPLNAAASANDVRKDPLDAMHLSESRSLEWHESAEDLLDSVGSQRPQRPKRKSAETSPECPAADRKPQPQPEGHFVAPQHKLRDGSEDKERYCSRPLHQLDLNHFKINLRVNGGIDYPYTEVIRNQDQRKRLPGCTRSECCGSKFRAVAATLPKLTPNTKPSLGVGLLDDDSPQESDDYLLVNFLGPESKEWINTLAPPARESLLLDAKTKIAADRYGKMHRHRHDRPVTPPGFWRTEMPETQEREVDRLDAKKRERDKIERRYRDACREGGMWMFADEWPD